MLISRENSMNHVRQPADECGTSTSVFTRKGRGYGIRAALFPRADQKAKAPAFAAAELG